MIYMHQTISEDVAVVNLLLLLAELSLAAPQSRSESD